MSPLELACWLVAVGLLALLLPPGAALLTSIVCVVRLIFGAEL